MTEIALAYSSIDKARAEAVARVLEALGYKLAPQPINSASVAEARALVVFWSSGSVNSIPINQLASEASMDRKLVCVRAGHTDPPAAFALVALHDLSRWTGAIEAPELHTFLQHIVRMAPPSEPKGALAAQMQPRMQPAPPRQPMSVAGGSAQQFSFAGGPPMGLHPPPRPMQAPPQQPAIAAQAAQAAQPAVRPAPAPAPQQAAARAVNPATAGLEGTRASAQQWAKSVQPQPPLKPEDNVVAMPQRRIAERTIPRPIEEPRRARGGGVARVAFGVMAVSVIAGAAVAAFNYQASKSSPDTRADTSNDWQAPPPSSAASEAQVTVAVAPNTLPEEAPTVAAPAAPSAATVTVAANTISAAPVPAAPKAAPASASLKAPITVEGNTARLASATVQPNSGWQSSLPENTTRTARAAPLPSAPRATLVAGGDSASTVAPGARPRRAIALSPIDKPRPLPAPADIVAVDNANLGDAQPKPTVADERALLRKQGEYGPPQ